MRLIALIAAASLTSAAMAQDKAQPATQPETKPTAPTAVAPIPEQPVSKAIPVPDGPIVKKQDLEGGTHRRDTHPGRSAVRDGWSVLGGSSMILGARGSPHGGRIVLLH